MDWVPVQDNLQDKHIPMSILGGLYFALHEILTRLIQCEKKQLGIVIEARVYWLKL